MSEGSFWDDQSAAQTVITEANRLKNVVNPSSAFRKEMDDLKAMLELVDEIGEDPEGESYQQEIIDTLRRLKPKLDQLELVSFLSGPHDSCNAFLTVNSGAGGTESLSLIHI